MKTLTLTARPYNFLEALQKLVDGECLGIKPAENINYLVMTDHEPEIKKTLVWHNSNNDGTCRVHQFLNEPWYLVIVDHRELKGDVK